jgi:capsular polysaccharide biosynthesis protein
LDVRSTLETLRRRWLIVLLVPVLVGALALAVTLHRTPVYKASAQGLASVAAPQTRSANVLTSGSLYILARMTSYAQLGETRRVLDPVAASLHLGISGRALGDRVSTSAVVNTAFIDVTAEADDPDRAAEIADATVRQLGTTVGQLENGTIQVTLSSPAVAPPTPSNFRFITSVGVGLFLGLLLGMGLALGLDRISARRRGRASAR